MKNKTKFLLHATVTFILLLSYSPMTFAVGTAPVIGSGIDTNTKLMIHSDSTDGSTTFTDSSDSGHIITRAGEVHHEEDQKQFGATSMYLDGDGDSLVIPDSDDWEFSSDFTIDMWIYVTDLNNDIALNMVGTLNTGDRRKGFKFTIAPDGSIYTSSGTTDASNDIWSMNTSPSTPITENQWSHVALVRNETSIKIYVDGVEEGSGTSNTATVPKNGTLNIGRNSIMGFYFKGYMDEIRISKGIARWTENFTPPVAPYSPAPYITGTPKIGEILTGNYTFYDPEGNSEGTSTFKWYRADTAEGSYSEISGATSITYIPIDDDIDQYIKFEVTPVSTEEPTTGTAVLSSALAINPNGGIDSNTVLMIRGNENDPIPWSASETFSESSSNGTTITVSGNATGVSSPTLDDETGKSGFGECMDFDGTVNTHIEGSSTALSNVGQDAPFTIDFWVRFDAIDGDSGFFTTMNADSPRTGFTFYLGGTNSLNMWGTNADTTIFNVTATGMSSLLTTGQWYHFATINDGTNLKTYVDGVEKATGSVTGIIGTAPNFEIGGQYYIDGGTNYFNGQIEEFRFSDIPRWTSNFTPPTVPYSAPPTAPYVTGVSITGEGTIGDTLTGNYTYDDANGDSEGTSTFRWLRADTEGGVYSAIEGATNNTYTLLLADYQKYLKFEVTPVSTEAPNIGNPVMSDASSQIIGTAPSILEYDSETKLMIHSDTTDGSTTFIDSSANGHTITRYGDTYHEEDQKQFGATSMYLDGDGDSLVIPDSDDWEFSSDFTIDMWIYVTDLNNDIALNMVGTLNTGDRRKGFKFTIAPDGSIYTSSGTTDASNDIWSMNTSPSTPIAENQWNHVALVRSGTSIKIYVDGVEEGSGTSNTATVPKNGTLNIGRNSIMGFYFKGYMDEIRISKGIARWTENFTPPTAPYAAEPYIAGISQIGETLTGNYNFYDPEGDSEGTSTFKWYSATTVDGTYTEISGATSITYVLIAADYQKYLKFEVTPIADAEPFTGSSVMSSPSEQVIGTAPKLRLGVDSYTKLMIHSDTTDESTTFIDSSDSGHIITRAGEVHHEADQKQFGATSMYFDGSGNDYIRTTDHVTDLNFETDDFTIDFWVYDSDLTNNSWYVVRSGNNNDRLIIMTKSSGNNIRLVIQDEGVKVVEIEGAHGINSNEWFHVALVRNGNEWDLYINGVSKANDTDTSAVPDTSGTNAGLYIGTGVNDASSIATPYYTGYIDELRISKGIARWTENFTPPTVPYSADPYITGTSQIGETLTGNYTFDDPEGDSEGTSTFKWYSAATVDGTYSEISGETSITYVPVADDYQKYLKFEVTPVADAEPYTGSPVMSSASDQVIGTVPEAFGIYDSETKLLIHSDTTDGSTTFIDSSVSAHVITPTGDTYHETDQKQFGDTSMHFDGDGDYLNVPDSDDWNFGSEDFTIDSWIMLDSLTQKIITSQFVDSDNRTNFQFNNTLGLLFFIRSGGTNLVLISQGDTTGWSIDTWYHIAVIRDGNDYNLYRNGVLIGSGTDADDVPDYAAAFTVGFESGQPLMSGHMDELRVSKGIARWTENFTPPTAPYSPAPYITGNPITTQTLTGNYIYYDTDSDPEGTSTFRWLSASTIDGTYSEISDATSITYIPVDDDIDQYIKFEVTPVSTEEPTTGTPILSNAIGPITPPNAAPYATDIIISGTEKVSYTLTGNYTYADTEGDLEGDTSFRWLRADTVDGTYNVITDTNTKLLLHGDGTGQNFTDDSLYEHTITSAGDVTQSITESQFGGSSIYFDGTGDYLSIPDSDNWDFGSGDFTIDAWIYRTNAFIGQPFVVKGSDSSHNWYFGYDGNVGLYFQDYNGATGVNLLQGDTSGWNPNTWYHIALVRNGNDFNIYRDGISIVSTIDSAAITSYSGALGIMNTPWNTTGKWNGYVDEIRISKGIARWTSNFTPPTIPHVITSDSTYTLTSDDVNKYLKFEVTPKAQTGTTPGSPTLSSATSQIAYPLPPEANDVIISGTTTVGQILTGSYTYADIDNDPEGNSTFRWLQSDTIDGTYTEISEETNITYTITSANQGKYLKFEVTPQAQIPPTPGSPATSSAIGPILGTAPISNNVSISGEASFASTITGNYTYTDNENDPEGDSLLRWLQADTAGGTYSEIPGAINSTYTLTSAENNKYIRFETTPVSSTGTPNTGATVVSPPIGPVQSYATEIWPDSLEPEGDIIVYEKVWKSDAAFTPHDVIIELRAASDNSVLGVHTLSSGTVSHCGETPENCITDGDESITTGTYSTRKDSEFGSATFKTAFSGISQQNVRLKIYAYNSNYDLLAENAHADFEASPLLAPAVSINAVTTPTDTTLQTISGTVTEAHFDNTDPNAFTLNGSPATLTYVSGDDWTFSEEITLIEGTNVITTRTIDKSDNQGSDTTVIVLDTTPPATTEAASPYDPDPPAGGTEPGWSRSGKALLNWLAATDDTTGIQHYEVWRSATSHPPAQGQSAGEDAAYAKVSADLSPSTLNWTDTDLLSNTTYDYQIKAVDGIDNTSLSNEVSILADNESPSVTITQPTASTATNNNSITVEADFADTFITDCHVKANGTWSNMAGGSQVQGTATYTYSELPDTKYDFTVECWDEAGNYITDTTTQITVDTINPTTFMEINNADDTTTNTSVTLTIRYSDDRSGVDQCRYKNESGGTWSNWESCVATKAWTLDSNLGTKTIYYEVKDNAGNTTETSDTILLRAEEPPVADNATITGIKLEEEIITGSYSYSDLDGDTEGSSSYKWLVANTSEGTYTEISGATNTNYALTTAETGKYIKFEVTPISATGNPNTGLAAQSNVLGPILGLASLEDHSASGETEIELDTSTSGSAQLSVDTAIVVLDTDQKLEFEAALEITDASTTEVGGTTIEEALEAVTGSSSANVESVVLESGLEGEDIVLVSTDNLQVQIPDGTNVFAPPNWDGTIAPPKNVTTSVTPPTDGAVEGAVSIGTPGIILILDKPAKVVIPSSAGKPYYSVDGTNWIEITSECNDVNGTGLNFPEECYFITGENTVVWTYHFTDFGDLTDTTPPTIDSGTLAQDNSYMDVFLNEEIYKTPEGTGGLSITDFNLTFTQNGGTVTSMSINDVTKTDNDPLSGGETTVRVHLLFTGIPTGGETVSISPADGNSIFDAAGNPAANTETTGNIDMHTAPTASNLSVSGTTSIGETLTGNYTYSDVEGDEETSSIFKWYRSNTIDGTYVEISDANNQTYILTNGDQEKYIKFQVTPITNAEPTTGIPSLSSAAGPVTGSAPTASNAAISGTLVASQILTGTYRYSDNEGDIEGNSTYKWSISDTFEGTYTEIAGATGKLNTISVSDIDKYIKFEITPVSSTGSPDTGTAVLSPASGPIVSDAPVAGNVSITGITTIGEILTGNYTYSNPLNNTESNSQYRWLRSDTIDGTYSPISGASEQTYALTIADENKYLKFEITPATGSGLTPVGTTQLSLPVGPILGLVSIIDYSAVQLLQITLDTSVSGIASLPIGKINLILAPDQKLEFAAGLVTNDPATTNISGTTIKSAIETVTGESFTDNNVDSVLLNSGVSGKAITLASEELQILIPDNTTLYAPPSWNGTIEPPIDISTGSTIAVSVGVPDLPLILDNPVKLIIPTNTGIPSYRIGENGIWVAITNECTNADGNGVSFPEECYFRSGENTIIWTYHLTQYGCTNTVDIGLRYSNGTTTTIVAIESADVTTSPLRINRNGTVYGIILVDLHHPNASPIRIETPGGIVKALMKAFPSRE